MVESTKEEITRLRIEVDSLRLERDRLVESQDEMLGKYEEDFQTKKLELEKSVANRIKESKVPLLQEVEQLNKQISNWHRASMGDTCGWQVKTYKDDSAEDEEIKEYYENAETSEQSDQIPSIYKFSLRIKNMMRADVHKNDLEKMRKKVMDASNAKRLMEVKVNESRTEVNNLKKKLREATKRTEKILRSLQGKHAHIRVISKLTLIACNS